MLLSCTLALHPMVLLGPLIAVDGPGCRVADGGAATTTNKSSVFSKIVLAACLLVHTQHEWPEWPDASRIEYARKRLSELIGSAEMYLDKPRDKPVLRYVQGSFLAHVARELVGGRHDRRGGAPVHAHGNDGFIACMTAYDTAFPGVLCQALIWSMVRVTLSPPRSHPSSCPSNVLPCVGARRVCPETRCSSCPPRLGSLVLSGSWTI